MNGQTFFIAVEFRTCGPIFHINHDHVRNIFEYSDFASYLTVLL